MSKSRIELSLRLPFRWDSIEPARQSVISAIAAALSDSVLADQMGVAASELLENAVKHGREEELVLTLQESDGSLAVVVRSALHPDDEGAEVLLDRLLWLKQFDSPRQAYFAAMSAVYEQTEPSASSTQSTLGLVRIAFEGNCRMECSLSEPGYVSMKAVRSLPDFAAPKTESPC